jgi:hypothetical protein
MKAKERFSQQSCSRRSIASDLTEGTHILFVDHSTVLLVFL